MVEGSTTSGMGESRCLPPLTFWFLSQQHCCAQCPRSFAPILPVCRVCRVCAACACSVGLSMQSPWSGEHGITRSAPSTGDTLDGVDLGGTPAASPSAPLATSALDPAPRVTSSTRSMGGAGQRASSRGALMGTVNGRRSMLLGAAAGVGSSTGGTFDAIAGIPRPGVQVVTSKGGGIAVTGSLQGAAWGEGFGHGGGDGSAGR
jgi:hypothetical protein